MVMVAGLLGGAVCVAMNMKLAVRHNIPSIIVLTFPVLFLALGYSFLDHGLNIPKGDTGSTAISLVCAAFFALFGGFLLIRVINAVIKAVPEPAPGNITIQNLDVEELIQTASPRAPNESNYDVEGDPLDGAGLVDELQQLAALHRTGALSDAEFESAKRRILGEDSR